MQRPAKLRKAAFAAGFFLLAMMGIAGQASATAKPKFVYVANSGGVWGYTIDGTSGALTVIPGSPFSTGLDPYAVAVDPSNRFVYVANASSNNVSAFAVDSTTGVLTPVPGSPFAAGSSPYAVVVDPSDKFVYVVNKASNNVSAYALNKTTGVLTESSGSPFPAGTGPIFATMDPLGRFVYVTNGSPEKQESISEYVINKTTGALTPVPGSPVVNGSRNINTPVAAVVTPSGNFLYDYFEYESGTVFSYSIDSTTGNLTSLGNPPAPLFPTTATIDPSGKFLYAAQSRDSFLEAYSVDSSTGALTGISMPFTPTGRYPSSMKVDPSGRFVYLVNKLSNSISGYSIDGDTGALTPIPGSTFATGTGPTSLAIASSSNVPFKHFQARAWVDEARRTSFRVQGIFRLGDGSDGIDPESQSVELEVGPLSVTIPAGSFRKRYWRGYHVEGRIDGVDLDFSIRHEDWKDYSFELEGRGTISKWFHNPVTIGLTIGEDTGSTNVRADIDK